MGIVSARERGQSKVREKERGQSKLGEHREHGEHRKHGKDGKFQADYLKYSTCDSKKILFGNQMTQNTFLLRLLCRRSKKS